MPHEKLPPGPKQKPPPAPPQPLRPASDVPQPLRPASDVPQPLRPASDVHIPHLPEPMPPMDLRDAAAPKALPVRTPIIWPNPATPRSAKTWQQPDVDKVVRASHFAKQTPIYTDTKYVSLAKADWLTILAQANERSLKYVPEVHDCDDYAALMRGLVPALADVNGIAIVLDPSSQHAYNAVLWHDEKDPATLHVAAVEPQTDAFADLSTGHYKAQSGWMFW